MNKKELEAKFNHLKERFETLAACYDKLACIVNNDHSFIQFLSEHDRGEVIVNNNKIPYITFTFGTDVFHMNLPHDVNDKCVYSVCDNTKTDCIIKADNTFCPRYYKLDKTRQTIIEVTEFYKRAEFQRMEESCELKLEKEPTEEKCDCKCKKGGKK